MFSIRKNLINHSIEYDYFFNVNNTVIDDNMSMFLIHKSIIMKNKIIVLVIDKFKYIRYTILKLSI